MKLPCNLDAKASFPRGNASGFTLAEVLAALLFMAIVIPVAMQALQVASLAGEVARRKSDAVRVAERVLNESLVTTNWYQTSQRGIAYEGLREYQWTLLTEFWDQNNTNRLPSAAGLGQLAVSRPMVDQFALSQLPMNLLTVEVSFPVRGRDYSVRLSTLVSLDQ
jgi:type II secretory pathway pseudopilin PulG